eukprot:scaffold66310_cov27-Phaeocystis_antarctica.AAC.1
MVGVVMVGVRVSGLGLGLGLERRHTGWHRPVGWRAAWRVRRGVPTAAAPPPDRSRARRGRPSVGAACAEGHARPPLAT